MAAFFKSFGKGILYILALPAILVVLVIFAIYGFFVFLYMTIKNIILFFTGRKIFDELPEDKKAREIIEAKLKAATEPAPAPQPQQNNTTVNNIYGGINPQPGTITVTIPINQNMFNNDTRSPIEIANEEAMRIANDPSSIQQINQQENVVDAVEAECLEDEVKDFNNVGGGDLNV